MGAEQSRHEGWMLDCCGSRNEIPAAGFSVVDEDFGRDAHAGVALPLCACPKKHPHAFLPFGPPAERYGKVCEETFVRVRSCPADARQRQSRFSQWKRLAECNRPHVMREPISSPVRYPLQAAVHAQDLTTVKRLIARKGSLVRTYCIFGS